MTKKNDKIGCYVIEIKINILINFKIILISNVFF